jgi:phospholipid/cholesterol/gamma-HCH transport system substrate-binding protein
MTTLGTVIRRRVLGLVFLIGLASLIGLSVAVYLKAFTPVLWVTLHTGHTGLQLNPYADVKVRGALVGEVRDIVSNGDRATLTLALDPRTVAHVPSNVSARLLPKTLFGEKYVSLVPPRDPAPQPIRNGAVIDEDRSQTAIELGRALDDLLPLLKAVKPDKLAVTLSAIARGIQGRGERLGSHLADLGDYLARVNREMPTIREDIRRLANVLEIYDRALPDLVEMLRNLTVTATTVSEQRTQLRSMLVATADVGDETRFFLDRYGARMIQLGEVSVPVTGLWARYSPQFPCLLNGLVLGHEATKGTFDTGRLHVSLEIITDQGKYQKGADEPKPPGQRWRAKYGPNCWGLPEPPVPFPPWEPPDTGYDFGHDRSHVPGPPGGQVRDAGLLTDPTMGYAGVAEEQALVKPLVAAATDTPVGEVGDLAVLLWGPLLRGAVVNLR